MRGVYQEKEELMNEFLKDKKKWIELGATVLLLLYFISATFNQSVRIAGVQTSNHTQVWHIFHLSLGLLCLFSILSKRELGYWFLVTIFLWQIPVEFYGAYISVQKNLGDAGQIVEPFFNVFGLVLLFISRKRYFST